MSEALAQLATRLTLDRRNELLATDQDLVREA
jgi:hypothetical protein